MADSPLTALVAVQGRTLLGVAVGQWRAVVQGRTLLGVAVGQHTEEEWELTFLFSKTQGSSLTRKKLKDKNAGV